MYGIKIPRRLSKVQRVCRLKFMAIFIWRTQEEYYTLIYFIYIYIYTSRNKTKQKKKTAIFSLRPRLSMLLSLGIQLPSLYCRRYVYYTYKLLLCIIIFFHFYIIRSHSILLLYFCTRNSINIEKSGTHDFIYIYIYRYM